MERVMLIKLIKKIMLDKRGYYSKSIAICEDDLKYIKELKIGKFGKKSLAGVLSYIIKKYEFQNNQKRREN